MTDYERLIIMAQMFKKFVKLKIHIKFSKIYYRLKEIQDVTYCRLYPDWPKY